MSSIDLYFDLSSPYSYMAATQLPAIAQRHGATIRWKPMVLMAVFDAAGNRMPASSPTKARWMLRDLKRWSDRYGVPFRLNSRFPLNTIPAMRLVLVGERHGRSQEVALEAFRRMWVEDVDINTPDQLAGIARAAGLPDGAEAEVADPEIKAALKASTDEAIARDVFGAPAIFVGDQLFFGNDRLDFVEDALRATVG
ncbi:MAG: 2-hydroxychromene-2-carboxylate isomerase [Alphaproteobacteria bacterium]|nr:2-hydroxychromene-2-carboxylate isomerase [Alphaproteobacteria bacterium]MCB9699850.1 2-hydroxychromene-2-carboxylate isomerase [Alphaproteobacteria bacterium]